VDSSEYAQGAERKVDSAMDSYGFDEFVDSMKDLDFEAMDEATRRRKAELDSEQTFWHKKDHYRAHQAAELLKRIRGLRFWLATGRRPDSLDDREFALLEPLCRKLVERKNLKPTALAVFWLNANARS
jgi:hypothetical protein